MKYRIDNYIILNENIKFNQLSFSLGRSKNVAQGFARSMEYSIKLNIILIITTYMYGIMDVTNISYSWIIKNVKKNAS